MPRLKERTYVNADKTKVVKEDSEEAAYMIGAEGAEVSDEEVEQYGLTSKHLMSEKEEAALDESANETDAKAVESAPENKALAPAENKAAGKKTKRTAK